MKIEPGTVLPSYWHLGLCKKTTIGWPQGIEVLWLLGAIVIGGVVASHPH